MKKWNDEFKKTPEGFHSAVERALGELEEREMRKSFRKMPLLVFAIIVMLAATAFAATNLLGGIVDWNGNYREFGEDELVLPTPPPDEHVAEDFDWNSYIEGVPDGEFWEIWHDGGGSGRYGAIGANASSYSELESMLAGAGIELADIPSGYNVEGFELTYNTFELEKYCYSKEEVENGAILCKYRVGEPGSEDIEGYWCSFISVEGRRINVTAGMIDLEKSEEAVAGEFMVEEDEQYETIESEKFDRGLVITRADGVRDIRLQRDVGNGNICINYYIYTDSGYDVGEIISMLFE